MKAVHMEAVARWVLYGLVALGRVAAADTNANLPPGTRLQVRISETICSETAVAGDVFHGMLVHSVVVDGRTVFPAGTDVAGEVVTVQKSGRLSTPGELQLVLRTIRPDFVRSYALLVQPVRLQGTSHAANNVRKVSGGTMSGLLAGAAVGAGKGALIGTGIGAAAGVGFAATTGKRNALIPSEAILTWVVTDQPAPKPANDDYRASSQVYKLDGEDIEEEDTDYYPDGPGEFSARERWIIRGCLVNAPSHLPPSPAKHEQLPSSPERQLRRDASLPPVLEKRIQPLPPGCDERLPRLPRQWSRVVLGGDVVLLDPVHRVMDFFVLDADE